MKKCPPSIFLLAYLPGGGSNKSAGTQGTLAFHCNRRLSREEGRRRGKMLRNILSRGGRLWDRDRRWTLRVNPQEMPDEWQEKEPLGEETGHGKRKRPDHPVETQNVTT